MVIPDFAVVEDDGSTEAPGGVNAGTGDWYGSQVNHENSKPNGQWSQYLIKLQVIRTQTHYYIIFYKCMYVYTRVEECIRGHGSRGRFSWGQWRRKRCRRARMCR